MLSSTLPMSYGLTFLQRNYIKHFLIIKIENADLEKPVNNLVSMRRTFIYIFGILFLHTAYGQQEETHQATTVRDTLQSVAVIDTLSQEQNLTALEKGRDFVIGGIEVKGAKHYNAQTIIVASGLKVGDRITIPSERFTRIIHKLWNYQVFNDIDIYIAKTEGDKVFLEFVIQEIPELTEVKVEGIRKRKAEELLKKLELDKTHLESRKKVNESLIAKNYEIGRASCRERV